MWTMSSLWLQVYSLRVIPCAAWCPTCQGDEPPCRARGRACGGHGGGGSVAPAPVLGSHQRIRLRRPGASLWGAAGRDHGSVWRVPLIVVALAVMLSLMPCCITYAVCLAHGNGWIGWQDPIPFPWPYIIMKRDFSNPWARLGGLPPLDPRLCW